MDLNGNGITVSNEVWKEMKPHLPKQEDGKPEQADQQQHRCQGGEERVGLRLRIGHGAVPILYCAMAKSLAARGQAAYPDTAIIGPE